MRYNELKGARLISVLADATTTDIRQTAQAIHDFNCERPTVSGAQKGQGECNIFHNIHSD